MRNEIKISRDNFVKLMKSKCFKDFGVNCYLIVGYEINTTSNFVRFGREGCSGEGRVGQN